MPTEKRQARNPKTLTASRNDFDSATGFEFEVDGNYLMVKGPEPEDTWFTRRLLAAINDWALKAQTDELGGLFLRPGAVGLEVKCWASEAILRDGARPGEFERVVTYLLDEFRVSSNYESIQTLNKSGNGFDITANLYTDRFAGIIVPMKEPLWKARAGGNWPGSLEGATIPRAVSIEGAIDAELERFHRPIVNLVQEQINQHRSKPTMDVSERESVVGKFNRWAERFGLQYVIDAAAPGLTSGDISTLRAFDGQPVNFRFVKVTGDFQCRVPGRGGLNPWTRDGFPPLRVEPKSFPASSEQTEIEGGAKKSKPTDRAEKKLAIPRDGHQLIKDFAKLWDERLASERSEFVRRFQNTLDRFRELGSLGSYELNTVGCRWVNHLAAKSSIKLMLDTTTAVRIRCAKRGEGYFFPRRARKGGDAIKGAGSKTFPQLTAISL